MSQGEPKVTWTNEHIFTEGDTYFEELVRLVENAASEILLEAYIVTADATSHFLLSALVRAHLRGVKVHLLLDGWGSSSWLLNERQTWISQGLRIRVFHPTPSLLIPTFFAKKATRSFLFRRGLQLNNRNHRKVCLIDNTFAFVGSANLTAVHSLLASGQSRWRDTIALVEGLEVNKLRDLFMNSWEKSWRYSRSTVKAMLLPPPFSAAQQTERALKLVERNFPLSLGTQESNSLVRSNETRVARKKSQRILLKTIAESKQRIWMTTAYFIPPQRILFAILRAARKGCEVQLLVPKNSDVPFTTWASAVYFRLLLRAGVSIYLFDNRMIHSKTFLFDTCALVGSSNLNHRSFLHDLEADVFLHKSESLGAFERSFIQDKSQSTKVTKEDLLRTSKWKIVLGSLCLLTRKWI